MADKRTLKKNKGLPARWRWIGSTLYYAVPPGQEALWDNKKSFRLGKTQAQAYAAWAKRMEKVESPQNCRTIGVLLDQFLQRRVPEFSVSYQEMCIAAVTKLKPVFGEMNPLALVPNQIQVYMAERSEKRKNENGKLVGGAIIANREIEVLQTAYAWAVWKGLINSNPIKDNVQFNPENTRLRYVEDWEIEEMFKVSSPRRKGSVHAIQAYIKLKLLTGMAKGDLLRLTQSDLKEDGIHIRRHKTAKSTGKQTIYAWSEPLRAAVNEAIKARPAISPFLFCKKDGKGYVNEKTGKISGWKSMWDRFRDKVLAETKVTESFTDHDIRAKVGSDAESEEDARKMLSHASAATTRKHYRRKPDIVPTGKVISA
jgi:integrase